MIWRKILFILVLLCFVVEVIEPSGNFVRVGPGVMTCESEKCKVLAADNLDGKYEGSHIIGSANSSTNAIVPYHLFHFSSDAFIAQHSATPISHIQLPFEKSWAWLEIPQFTNTCYFLSTIFYPPIFPLLKLA